MSSRYRILTTILAILTFSLLCDQATAWDLRFGYQFSLPRINVQSQDYVSSAGETLTFSPTLSQSIDGQVIAIGVGFDIYSINIERTAFSHGTTIPASNPAVTVDTSAVVGFEENRLDVLFHLEREIAGIFGGVGLSSVTERVTTDSNRWSYSTLGPYLKFGVDIMLRSFRIRYHQLLGQYGAQSVRESALGVIMAF